MHAQPLDPRSVPLQGTNLIEASAGTGKTWNIAMLFVRLVLLERLPVDQILVVTFTKAATAELKGRLRARLDEALSLLDAPAAVMGPADPGVVSSIINSSPLLSRYRDAVDNESAFELMQARLADAAKAAEEKAAEAQRQLEEAKAQKEAEKQAAKEEAARQKELERLQREVEKAEERKRREAEKAEERRARATQRVIESTVKSVGTTAARSLTRSILGTLFK